jgi:hypothetical protein
MKNLAKTITANSVYSGGVYINVIPEGVSGKSKRAQKAIQTSPILSKENQMTAQKTKRQIRETSIGADFAERFVNDYNNPESANKLNLIMGWPGSAKTSNVNHHGIQALVKNGVRLFVLAVPQKSISSQTYQAVHQIVATGVVKEVCTELGLNRAALTGDQFKNVSSIIIGGANQNSTVFVVVTSVQFVHSNVDLFTTGQYSPAVNGTKAVVLIDEGHIGVGNSTPENSITNKGHGYGEGKWASTFKEIMDSAPSLWRIYAMTASPTPSQLDYSTVDKMTPRTFINMDKRYRTAKDYTAYNVHFVSEDPTVKNKSLRKKKMAKMIYTKSLAITKARSIEQSHLYSLISENGKQWLTANGNVATKEMPNHFDGYCAPQALAVIGAFGKNGSMPSTSICYSEAEEIFNARKNSIELDFSVTYDKHLFTKSASGQVITGETPYEVYSHMRNSYDTPRVHHTYSMGLVGLNVPSIRVIGWTRHPSQDVDAGPLTNGMGRASRLICGKFIDSEDFVKSLWSDTSLSDSDKQAIHDYFLALNVSDYVLPDYRLVSGETEERDSECNSRPFPSKTVIEYLKEISFSKEEFYAHADEWKKQADQKLHIGTYLARAKTTKGMLCEHCAIVEYQGEQMPGCLANHLNTEQVSVQEALESYQQELRDEYVKSVLSVHHNDVDPTNNSEENLTTLCHNAHMTITHRGNHTGVRHTENRKTAVFGSSITTLKKINKAAKKQLRSVK